MGVPHWCILNVPGTETVTGHICTAWSLVCLGFLCQVHEFIILCCNFLFILMSPALISSESKKKNGQKDTDCPQTFISLYWESWPLDTLLGGREILLEQDQEISEAIL